MKALKASRNVIKKSARRDKKLFIAQNLQEDFMDSTVQQWTHARQIRADFRPKTAGLYNLQDKLVSSSQRATTFADYLSKSLWHSDSDSPVPVLSPFPPSTEVDSPFTMHDLDTALRRLKPNKASGPNEVPGEIYKHSPFILKMYLLAHYNQCFQEARVPPSWLFSEVVMIIKNNQKDSRLLSNYRPISLTNISYKIFASMLQLKLERSLDPRIRDRQFGFRKNRSTTQTIHIIRRLLEVFERQNSPFHALFVDWSKAFDSVTFTAIESAMEFVGVPAHTRKVIMSLYDNPTFLVRDSSQKSTIRTQTKGLRQGCPLSPYLFGFVLTHLFHDVETDYQTRFGEISGVIHVPSPVGSRIRR